MTNDLQIKCLWTIDNLRICDNIVSMKPTEKSEPQRDEKQTKDPLRL